MDLFVLLALFVFGVFKPKEGIRAFELDTLNHFLISNSPQPEPTTSNPPKSTPQPANPSFQQGMPTNPNTSSSVSKTSAPPTPIQGLNGPPKMEHVMNTTYEANAFNTFSRGDNK